MNARQDRGKNAPRRAARTRVVEGGRLRHRHLGALAAAWRRLRERPLAHGFAIALLAVGLLCVALLGVAADRFVQLTLPVADARSLSLFLTPALDAEGAMALAEELRNDGRVAAVDSVSPDAGLAELARVDGTSEALDALPDNPLPWVLSIEPVDRGAGVELADAWRQREEVEHVTDEGEWLDRADAALAAARTLALVLATLVIVALVMLAANAIRTIRVEGAAERALQRVFGATEADLRRPYLYLGVLYGVLASAIAVVAAFIVMLLVQPALSDVADLLGVPVDDPKDVRLLALAAMIPCAGLLGWIGARLGCLFEPDLESSEAAG